MEIDIQPEVNLARRVIDKFSLEPPIDIESLIKQYAEVIFANIPFEDIDGVSLNLKVLGKTARVIVNRNKSSRRQRFTMAHELGHILIPWHIGTIIDHANPDNFGETSHYWKVEAEANTFAAELLMPYTFVSELLTETSDLAKINSLIATNCNTSVIASSIRLAQLAPENVVYAFEKGGQIEFSGRTDGTIASPLSRGMEFPEKPYDYYEEHFTSTQNEGQLHWWLLPKKIHIDVSDSRPWREILDVIVRDVGIPSSEVQKVKSSINGVVAYANSSCKKNGAYDVASLVSACFQRFSDRKIYEPFIHHSSFKTFLVKKAEDLANRNS